MLINIRWEQQVQVPWPPLEGEGCWRGQRDRARLEVLLAKLRHLLGPQGLCPALQDGRGAALAESLETLCLLFSMVFLPPNLCIVPQIKEHELCPFLRNRSHLSDVHVIGH